LSSRQAASSTLSTCSTLNPLDSKAYLGSVLLWADQQGLSSPFREIQRKHFSSGTETRKADFVHQHLGQNAGARRFPASVDFTCTSLEQGAERLRARRAPVASTTTSKTARFRMPCAESPDPDQVWSAPNVLARESLFSGGPQPRRQRTAQGLPLGPECRNNELTKPAHAQDGHPFHPFQVHSPGGVQGCCNGSTRMEGPPAAWKDLDHISPGTRIQGQTSWQPIDTQDQSFRQ